MYELKSSPARIKLKETLLGRLEETVLLAVLACGGDVTAEAVQDKLKDRIGSKSMTTVLTTLDRLTQKGFLDKGREDEPLMKRGGKRKCLYNATNDGRDNAYHSLSVTNDLAREAGLLRA
jgi:DNA-binding PadR family transcriptional regulator